MPTIKEGALTFQFPDSWKVAKLDDWGFYNNQFIRLSSGLRQPCGECGAELRCRNCGAVKTQGVKAVDILARDPAATLWLLEVKDYRRSPRTKAIGLADEVALKVRDSLALLVAAAMSAYDPQERSFAREALEKERLCIGLHLEQPRQHSKLFPRAIDPADVLQKLRQLVRSIDPHPRIFEVGTNVTVPWVVSSGGPSPTTSESRSRQPRNGRGKKTER
jgi:hypothetical protein